jgi:Right handed beta helix region
MKIPFFPATIILSLLLFHPSTLRAQGALTPQGAPAATMKSLDQIEPRTPVDAIHTPGSGNNLFIITNAGSYYLTGNISASAINQVAISIASDNVTLDLNGFTLEGNSLGYSAIYLIAAHQNVIVRNGIVRNWANSGVNLSQVSNVTAEDLLVSSNASYGILAGENALVKNCRVFGNGSAGSAAGIATGAGASIVDCEAEGNNGASDFGISSGSSCSIINCTANQNNGSSGGGIDTGVSCMVVNCSAGLNNGTGSVGITLGNDSSAIHCNASDNSGSGGIGISAGSRCTISDCKAGNNSSDGIKAVGDCLISMNSASVNGGSGIHTTGLANRIDSNHVSNNSGNGIKVDSAESFIVRNSARSNSGGNYSIAASNADAQQLTVGTGFATTNAWANFSL